MSVFMQHIRCLTIYAFARSQMTYHNIIHKPLRKYIIIYLSQRIIILWVFNFLTVSLILRVHTIFLTMFIHGKWHFRSSVWYFRWMSLSLQSIYETSIRGRKYDSIFVSIARCISFDNRIIRLKKLSLSIRNLICRFLFPKKIILSISEVKIWRWNISATN